MNRRIVAGIAALFLLLAGCAEEPAADRTVLEGRGGMTDALIETEAGSDYVSVEGSGVEVDGSSPADGSVTSTVHIFTSPSELLHEGTGTWHAGGIIRFTVEGTEIVSDGRMQTVAAGVKLPSMFDYRIAGSSVDYRASWRVGSGGAGAGAVKVNCHHD